MQESRRLARTMRSEPAAEMGEAAPTAGFGRFSLRRVMEGGLTAFVIYGLGIGLAYCSQLIVAYFVGIDAFGLYAYAVAWVVPLAYVAGLGFDIGLLRFLPVYGARGEWRRMKGILRYSQRQVALTGISITVLGTVCVVASHLPADRMMTFILGFVMIPVLALLRTRCAAIRGLGGVTWAIVPDRMVREGTLIVLVCGASLGLGVAVRAPHVMLAMLIATVIGLIVTVSALRAQLPNSLTTEPSFSYDSEFWRRVTLPLLLIGAGEVLMNRIGVILLGWMADNKSAGIYSLAFNIAMVVTLPRLALNTLFAPALASHCARDDRPAMQMLVTQTTVWTLVAALAIGTILFAFADKLLGLFGRDYGDGVTALRILLVGQVIAAAAGPLLYVMTMSGYERGAARLLVVFTCLTGIMSVCLIPAFGAIGASFAGTIGLILWSAAMSDFLWRYLGLVPGVLASVTGRRGDESSGRVVGPKRGRTALANVFNNQRQK
jgi:O-antigen/teichoic acid export membrane protein